MCAACTHDAPGEPARFTPDAPRGSGPLVRLTYNPGLDQSPAWLPDGSGFVYTMERLDRSDRDRCLALMPAGGGTIERQICDRVAAADDSVNAWTAGAVSTDGRIAYVQASAPLSVGWPLAPYSQQLVVAPLDRPAATRPLRAIPYTGPSGRLQQGVSQVRWLGDSALVYVGQQVVYASACPGCPRDTLPTGLEVDVLDFRTATPGLRMLPGSDQASSVTVTGSDTVYFTVNGDSRVFRFIVSDDSLSVAHDFGLSGIVRDVQVVGSRLVAVLGGSVSFADEPGLGLVQRDGGGQLVRVDLANGGETVFTAANLFFRHPALSPDGRSVVAELITGRTSDLWLVAVP